MLVLCIILFWELAKSYKKNETATSSDELAEEISTPISDNENKLTDWYDHLKKTFKTIKWRFTLEFFFKDKKKTLWIHFWDRSLYKTLDRRIWNVFFCKAFQIHSPYFLCVVRRLQYITEVASLWRFSFFFSWKCIEKFKSRRLFYYQTFRTYYVLYLKIRLFLYTIIEGIMDHVTTVIRVLLPSNCRVCFLSKCC